MNRKTLLTTALTVLMAGSTSVVLAQTPPPPAPSKMASAPMHPAHAHHMSPKGHRMHNHHFSGQRGGVIGDLHSLERLYMQAGRGSDMVTVYNDVLSKSKNPRVRDYAYRHLARLQAKPANVDQSIATLRKALDENLANEAKMQAQREKMRTIWKSHHTMPAPAAPTK